MDFKRGLLLSGAIIGVCGFGGGAWAADAQAAPTSTAAADNNTVGDIVVVAERKSENLQQTPIAVSALSAQDLKAQRIDTGANLASTVPNMSFQPGLYGKPDFAIRGIGYQLVTTAGDAGVAVHENDAPVSSGRLAQADFFDINQVEVLRGPQGTLYGRNATGGVINIITSKPVDKFAGAITAEAGNYGTYKGNGFINIPLGDMFAVRVAGDFSKHDGYQFNEFNGTRTNAQNIWATRATVSFTPNSKFHAYLMWEHFAEDDSGGGNAGVSTNSCITDPGPSSIGGVAVTNAAVRNYLSFGCSLTPNIYAAGSRGGILNGVGTFGNRLAVENHLAAGNLFANNVQPTGAYDVNIDVNPTNLTRNDLAQFSAEWDITDSLKLSSLTTYDRDRSLYGAGGLRAATPFPFTITDPQIAGGQTLANYTSGTFDRLFSEEYSEEVRLASSFSGPVNFSVGAFYLHTHKNDAVFVFDNFNAFLGGFLGLPADPNPRETANGGHAYFESLNPYTLTSKAIFGEVYWNITPDLKLTGGFRYTSDHKVFDANTSASNLLSPVGGPPGSPAFGIQFLTPQSLTFNEPTGRVNLDWTPKLSFTDATLVYASYSHGYKGGGFNPPNLISVAPYAPEFVDALELGTKNTLLNHTLTLNLTGFYYDYKNYQFSQAAVFGTITNNVNARIWGLEFESQWRPIGDLALNAQVGYLNTRIKSGPTAQSINQYDPTGGHMDTLYAVKTLTSQCIVNKANFATLVNDIQNGVEPVSVLANLNCADTSAGSIATLYNLRAGVPVDPGTGLVETGGVPETFAGKRLPNTPDWTAAVGAQYAFHINDSWRLTPRVDVRYTGGQYADLFNTPGLYVKPYASVNVTVTLADLDNGFSAQAFAKNLGTQGTIVGAVPGGGAITGSENTIIIADPTTYGISLSKRF
ncbi:TonB-dependent receptor [Caulobacter sp. KR2-114]|uniref:TonB-dependent receptor n=1 Tax=Caulobacter sp. KR2-114 TaxID=3400912 RepID=UPI003C0E36E1